jgi:diguanylate cyclase (GGDEF)-like protein
MSLTEQDLPAQNRTGELGPASIQASLRQLDRQASWYWWNAVLVIMLLTGGIVVLSLPKVMPVDDPAFTSHLNLAVRALIGVVLLFNVYTLYQQHLLRQVRGHLAKQIEIASEQKARAEAYYELAVLDPLTGLYNGRFSRDHLHAEIARAHRQGTPLIVILFDLDNFKKINDRLGHGAGDLALREFARHLAKAIRGSDFAVRDGGDEFMVILPDCPMENVRTVLSRVGTFEAEFEGHRFTVSGSRGWAQYQAPETSDELLARADAALYDQKSTLSASVRGRKYGALRPALKS